MASLNDFIKEWESPTPWIEAHTSGSTGEPKTIRLLKSDIIISAQATNSYFGITENSVLAIPLSMNYIAGKMMAVRALIAKCELVELPVSNKIIVNRHFDLLAIVPSQIKSLLENKRASSLVSNLLIGGAPLDESNRRQVVCAGFKAFIGYGMTETCSHVALRSLDCDSPCYEAMPGIYFSTDSQDRLIINSNSFSWQSLTTNDIAKIHTEQKFEWMGRADNVINSGGVKIHPEQIENLIRQAIPDLPPFYIIGSKDEKWGERVVMVAECNQSNAIKILEQIIKLPLPKYSHPKEIVTVEHLPQTPGGNKLLRLPIESIRTY